MGGQAVPNGVMMRCGVMYALAVRLPRGEIVASRRRWRNVFSPVWLSIPLLRGFPILLDAVINGVRALSLAMEMGESSPDRGRSHLAVGVILALLAAVGLFIVAPHLLALAMLSLHLGGDLNALSFHIWDGFFKCAIFILYIWLISFSREIHQTLQYHGAEHKAMYAYERAREIDTTLAERQRRLHPRCGTTFLLFVICLSILVQSAIVPLALDWLSPANPVLRHCWSVFIKICLVVPVSCIAYELLYLTDRMPAGPLADLVQLPGLALQRLTTREPTVAQLEVALVALAEALGPAGNEDIAVPEYQTVALHPAAPE